MKTVIILAGLLNAFLLAFVPSDSLADSPRKIGPHGGVLLGNETRQLELSFDSSRSSVDVYVIKGKNRLPNSIGLTLMDSGGNRRVFELRALEGSTASPVQFHGSLSPGEQSYVGFEVKIPFTSEPPATFRSN